MPPARPERRYAPIPFWRRVRRILLLSAIACLIPAGVSYVGAMSEKHNVGLGVSSDRGPSEVPEALRKRVVATFNGGFPLETSGGGLIYRGRVVEAMVDGAATVVEHRDGRVDVVRWHQGPRAPANVWFAKQNLPPIIYEGRLNPNLSDGPEWGETVNNAVRVWRSGLGIDRRGNLIYAAADNQTVESLAKILQRAGAVRALELDINEDWTSFISYSRPSAVSPTNLLPEMFRPADRYLTPDERDFFAVYVRAGEKW
jgi:hypothetical protein